MDYLQYRINTALNFSFYRFKPYYKWITFNTAVKEDKTKLIASFKPYYKWITFNTLTLLRKL